MRSRFLLAAIVLASAVALPATAAADFAHVVGAGETLTSVAAADGLAVSRLAAANGVSVNSQLVAGSTLDIPPPGGGTAGAPAATVAPITSPVSAGGYVVRPGDTLSGIAAANGLSVDQLAAANGLDPGGVLVSGTALRLGGAGSPVASTISASTSATAGYLVRPGDTLSSIAAATGLSVDRLAASNGLDPNGVLVSGTSLSLGGGSETASTGGGGGGPQPTSETLSSAAVGQIAAANGVSPSLAEAIGYQESGFNNGVVSPSGATGVMQIEPRTWSWIGHNLVTPPPLSAASAADNVRGGVLLLRSLLDQTGGDPALAAAGYYQGLASVQSKGMYTDTQRYVKAVMALRQRFGGP